MVPITPLLVSISHYMGVCQAYFDWNIMGMGDLYMRFNMIGPRVTLKIKENCLKEKQNPANFGFFI
jgi:hypothetical protein